MICCVFQAHQQARKADMMTKSGKFESAICCHRRAAGNTIIIVDNADIVNVCGYKLHVIYDMKFTCVY